jgi:hypothetical protein
VCTPWPLLSPLRLIYVPLGLIYAPLGVKCAPPQARAPPLCMRPPLGICAPLLGVHARPSRRACLPSHACVSPLPGVCAPLGVRAHSRLHARPLSFVCTPTLVRVHAHSYSCARPLLFVCTPTLIRVRAPLPGGTRPSPRRYASLWQPFVLPIELCGLQPVQYNGSLHPTIQCGSNMAATVVIVTPVLPCQRSIWR